MSYLTGITSILNDTFLIKNKVIKGEAGCKDIELKGNFLILQTDHKEISDKVLSTIFKAGSPRSICDYVVVADNVILVCELKSNNAGKMKIQLKNTAKFVKYLLEIVKEHHDIAIKEPPIKYVFFSNSNGVPKQNTTAKKLDSIPWQNSELFKLPCNSIYHLNQFL